MIETLAERSASSCFHPEKLAFRVFFATADCHRWMAIRILWCAAGKESPAEAGLSP
jgi:hypothetical protein